MILAFAHPCLVVDDLEKASEFYQSMFGFRPLSREAWSENPAIDMAIGSDGSSSRGCLLAGHNCFLELFEFDAPARRQPDPIAFGPQELGIRHLAFYVDDCRVEYQRALALGASAQGRPAARESGVNAVYFRDPCGNIVELCEIGCPEEEPTSLPGISRLNQET